jgi:hypothetical protein
MLFSGSTKSVQVHGWRTDRDFFSLESARAIQVLMPLLEELKRFRMRVDLWRSRSGPDYIDQRFYEKVIIFDNLSSDLPLPWELPRPRVKHTPLDLRRIDEVVLWEILENAKLAIPRGHKRFSDEWNKALAASLVEQLKRFKKGEIKRYHTLFYKKLRQLSKKGLSDVVFTVNGHISDDSYLYSRAGIVMLGRTAFEAILKEPSAIARFVEPGEVIECEEILSSAEDTFTAIGWDDFNLGSNSGDDELQGELDEQTLRRRYPELTARFERTGSES